MTFLRTLFLSLALVRITAAEDTPNAPGNPPRSGSTETTTDVLSAPKGESRPGRFRVGPLYLTPTFRIGTLGLDTNVFYTATDRRTDISGSGGPGMTIALPLSDRVRILSDGSLNYLYFARTASQRRLMEQARSTFDWAGARTHLAVQAEYSETFARPAPEIDTRVDTTAKAIDGRLERRTGRTVITFSSSLSRTETENGAVFLGTDLRRSLSRDVLLGGAELAYALTPKTQLVLNGLWEDTRYLEDESRNASRPLATAGLRTDASALIAGQLMIGSRWFLPADASQPPTRGLYVNVDATWHLTGSTDFGGGYQRDTDYTAFTVAAGRPTLRRETVTARLRQLFGHRIELILNGRRLHSRTDSAVQLTLDSGEVVDLVRDDITYEGIAELGYKVANRLWAGGTAGYGERQSTVSDFGVRGLIVGAKITFTP